MLESLHTIGVITGGGGRRRRRKAGVDVRRGMADKEGVFLNDLFTTINADCLISCYE